MDASTLTTTRKQLRGYGASHYLARRLTRSLEPITKSGNAYVYALAQVVTAARNYSEQARVQPTTKQILEQMLTQLVSQIDNVVPMLPDGHRTAAGDAAKLLLKQMHRTDKAMAELKATVASIGGHKR